MTITQTDTTRTIEVSPFSDTAGEIASLLSSRADDADRDRIQSFSVSIDDAVFTRSLLSPPDLLADIGQILADSDLDRVPNDPGAFEVTNVKIDVEGSGIVRITLDDE